MNSSDLDDLMQKCKDKYYKMRIQKLSQLKLRDLLRKQKPNFFRSIAVKGPVEIVDELLYAYLTAADETLFGDAFFEPITQFCSGGKVSQLESANLSDQIFWEELTGDPDFYIKLIQLMRDYPTQHRVEFEIEWGNARTRFMGDFVINFGNPDGSIDWEKLLRYNSGKEQVPWVKVATVVSVEDEGDEEDIEDDDAEEEAVDEF